ncbi:MAG: RNA 2',3'-cyclic phosphodiesterase [Thermoplasmatales archaeon]|nr:RNA 2',3'-cyclic phosphodiesterase [Thermoplasmatales archaeon]
MPKFRGFIAIDVDSFPKLIQFENEIRNSGAFVKLVEPKNIHITLKFLGDTNEEHIDKIEKILKDAVKDSDPFEIKLKGTGVFPNQNYIKVMWIGMENGEQIGKIADKIDEEISELGFKKENRGFSAHLTIARVKSAKNKEKLLELIEKYRDIEFGSLKIDTIKLKKSELTPKGPIYTTLKEVKL